MSDHDQKPAYGRLRVFLGYAPGVGESLSMLDEVRRRWGQGQDVVAGALRPEISNEPLVNSLEIIPTAVKDVPVIDVPAVLNGRTWTSCWRRASTWSGR